MDTDVVVVGAGPVGLLLASELTLGGARAVVLERHEDPVADPIKQGEMGARSLNAPSVHAMRRRGLLPAIRSAALMWWDPDDAPSRPGTTKDEQPAFAGHFAGIMLRADRIDFTDPELADRGDGAGVIAQAELERILGERARKLGVTIRTGVTVTKVDQATDSVTAVTDTGPVRARWLVGCDGGRSVVRKQSGIEFPGDDAESVSRQVLVDMTDPEALLPGGLHECEGGIYLLGGWEMRLRPTRIMTIEPGGVVEDRDAPVTAPEMQDSIRRVCGIDTEITAIHAATRYTDTTRQAATYRAGRVFLAGDAAHVHSPAGGQGLNLGIGDAMNLGWKLAAVLRGDAEESLLDTYTEERHPIGAWVQEWTKAQAALSRTDTRTKALRAVMTDLLDTKAGATYVLKKIAGVTVHYDLPGDHDLIGKLAPPLPATIEAAADGRFVLATPDAEIASLATQWPNRITTVPQRTETADALSALIRPDGFVCWAGTTPESAQDQWPTWLGQPTADRPPVETPVPAH